MLARASANPLCKNVAENLAKRSWRTSTETQLTKPGPSILIRGVWWESVHSLQSCSARVVRHGYFFSQDSSCLKTSKSFAWRSRTAFSIIRSTSTLLNTGPCVCDAKLSGTDAMFTSTDWLPGSDFAAWICSYLSYPRYEESIASAAMTTPAQVSFAVGLPT